MVRITILMLLLIFAANAWAYLDPGTGSYFFQILIGMLVGITFSLKIFWGKIKAFFSRNTTKKCSDGKPE